MSDEENIQYPPFCDLCLVKFNGNSNAKLHFDGDNHRNKVMLVFNRVKNNPNLIWCDICCCELNTNDMLNIHKQSDKHKKKEAAQMEILQLKEEYLAFLKNLKSDEKQNEGSENKNDDINL